jgi:8-oxo-dGTP pyrophosphatase MutT (NUDIX family)
MNNNDSIITRIRGLPAQSGTEESMKDPRNPNVELADAKKRLYVVGFMFCNSHVLLVRKNRPDWQVGLWNGVGGGCGPAEHPHVAMPREFKEETGIETTQKDWTNYAVEIGPDYQLYCYKARHASAYPPEVPARNDVGEDLVWWPFDVLDASRTVRMVGNLRWMIPLAIDWRRFSDPIVFITNDDIREGPTW